MVAVTRNVPRWKSPKTACAICTMTVFCWFWDGLAGLVQDLLGLVGHLDAGVDGQPGDEG